VAAPRISGLIHSHTQRSISVQMKRQQKKVKLKNPPNVTIHFLALLLCTQEAPGAYSGNETVYCDLGFRAIS